MAASIDDLIFMFEHPESVSSNPPFTPLVFGDTLFKGALAKISTSDGPLMSITETGGTDEGTHNSLDVPAYVKPSFQFAFRAKNADDAKVLADAVYAFLYPLQNVFINGTWWMKINATGLPGEIAPDARNRARFVFNVESQKRTSPQTSL